MTDTIRTLTVTGLTADPIMVGDTLWSHAITLGPFIYNGKRVEMTRAKIESFIKNFTTGYPSKVPVDYEHGSALDAEAMKGQPIPKAGDVVELRGVYSVDDFKGDLKTAAEKIIEKNGRQMDDPDNFGLWIRWRPLARALTMIKAGEITEHSIEYYEECTNLTTGAQQGPTLFAVALTNRPHRDRMNSIAATRDGGGSAAAPPSGDTHMPTALLLSAAAAVSGKTVATDEEATTILTAAAPEITRLRAFQDKLSVELGEVEPDKAHAKLREIKNENADFRLKAEKAEQKRIDDVVASTMKEFEDRTTPFSRDKVWAPALRTELRANAQLDVKQTETYKALKQEKPHNITTQSSSGDPGITPTNDDRLLARVREIQNSDEEVKELVRQGKKNEAFALACEKAEDEFDAQRARQS